jgi:hypothetical protein
MPSNSNDDQPRPCRAHSEYHGTCVCGKEFVLRESGVCGNCHRGIELDPRVENYPVLDLTVKVPCDWCGGETVKGEQPCNRHTGRVVEGEGGVGDE